VRCKLRTRLKQTQANSKIVRIEVEHVPARVVNASTRLMRPAACQTTKASYSDHAFSLQAKQHQLKMYDPT
jgi:predicted GNAT family N-acyltransferase